MDLLGQCKFFDGDMIARAFKIKSNTVNRNRNETFLGIDPSMYHVGTAMVWRKGHEIIRTERLNGTDNLDCLAEQIYGEIKELPVSTNVFIDIGGVGGRAERVLRQMRLERHDDAFRIIAVRLDEPAGNEMYIDKRAELYDNMYQWMRKFDVSCAPSDEFLEQFKSVSYMYNPNWLCISPKTDVPFFPNLVEALALTFYYGVPRNAEEAYSPPMRLVCENRVFD